MSFIVRNYVKEREIQKGETKKGKIPQKERQKRRTKEKEKEEKKSQKKGEQFIPCLFVCEVCMCEGSWWMAVRGDPQTHAPVHIVFIKKKSLLSI